MRIIKKSQKEFWITNISPRNVTLTDLALNIKAFSSINLLDSKHHSYTLEQIVKSSQSGSIFNKQHFIKVRKLAPIKPEKQLPNIDKDSTIPNRQRSIYNIKEERYEELEISNQDQKLQEEFYAKENADLAELDIQRSINSKKV